jgi:hypothetical protein
MSPTTTTAAAPDASATAAAAAAAGAPAPAGLLATARAFAVMLGGPLVLLAATAGAATHALRRLRRGRLPRTGSAAVLGAGAGYAHWIVPRMRRWGALDYELRRALPGDEVTPNPAFQQTHVVQIEAPAQAVWPWIAQIGQDRGGFYSYAWLENLAGCRMRNADRIHPEWQQRVAGETVLLHPATGLKVLRFEPGRALVLEGGWSLVVEDGGPGRCRLIARFRAPAGAAGAAYAALLELPHFVMERRMLLEIKRLAERGT